ncbi:MAG: ATP synthase F0 subunit B [Candidatus Desulfofervidus auxilii]|nr:ATP synthase F0 subunit B [Candidatus Desulfofervidus auxilii]
MISVSVDKSCLIHLVNFVILIFILNALLYKPIREAIRQRKQRFEKDQEEISRLEAESEKKLKEFEIALEEARKNGMAQRESIVKAAHQEEKSLLDKIRKEMEEYLEKVKAEVSKDMQEARERLKGEIKAISADIAQKILGRPVNYE